MKKVKVKSKVRFTFFLVLTISLMLCVGTYIFNLSQATALTDLKYISTEVKSGDTLWSIANEYMPSNMDIRKAVYIISDTNNISPEDLVPGTVIKIPML